MSNHDIKLDELELPQPKSYLMDYRGALTEIVGDALYVGYLTDDDHPFNPFEEFDGLGRIYTTNLNNHEGHDRYVMGELALDEMWIPDAENTDRIFQSELFFAWMSTAINSTDFKEYVRANSNEDVTEVVLKKWVSYVWDDDETKTPESIYDFDFTEDVVNSVWTRLREQRRVGNPYAVLCEYCEGAQNPWKTSYNQEQYDFGSLKTYGIWVPEDEDTEAEVERRAESYIVGEVHRQLDGQYWALIDEEFGGFESPKFKAWGEAFSWLSEWRLNCAIPLSSEAFHDLRGIALSRASIEMAKEALTLYNQYATGDTYGVVVAKYKNVGSRTEPEWEFDSSDEVWGYYGEEHALSGLQDHFGGFQHEAETDKAHAA